MGRPGLAASSQPSRGSETSPARPAPSPLFRGRIARRDALAGPRTTEFEGQHVQLKRLDREIKYAGAPPSRTALLFAFRRRAVGPAGRNLDDEARLTPPGAAQIPREIPRPPRCLAAWREAERGRGTSASERRPRSSPGGWQSPGGRGPNDNGQSPPRATRG